MRRFCWQLGWFFIICCSSAIVEARVISEAAVGHKRLAIVLLDYGRDGKNLPVGELMKGFFDSPYSIANFISKASYGKTTISGHLYGWIQPEKPLYGSGWTACWPIDQDKFKLLLKYYPTVNLTDYDGFIFYVHRKEPHRCAAGVANTHGVESRSTYTQFGQQPFGKINTRIAFVSTRFYFPYQAYSGITDSTVAHELIHTLGISNHSNAYVFKDKKLSSNFSEGEILAYGDIFSIMGMREQASHPNSVTKERLGWLSKESIIRVDRSGRHKIYAMEDQQTNIKALKIPLSKPIKINDKLRINYIYVEYRNMTGFDKRRDYFRKIKLRNGGFFKVENTDGALVYAADCYSYEYCMPYLLNMHPGSVDAAIKREQLANAYLFAGESFDIPENDIKITVLRANKGKSLVLEVKFNEG